MLRRWLIVVPILCFIGSAPAHAGRADPLFTPEPIEVPAGKSADEVKNAVRRALLQRNWRVKEIARGHVEAKYSKAGRRGVEHVATVDIQYDTKNIRIAYKDSQELNYDKDANEIHPTYNKWVRNLEKDIRLNLGAY